MEEDLGGVRSFMDMDMGLDEDKDGEREVCLKMMVRSAGRAEVSTSIWTTYKTLLAERTNRMMCLFSGILGI